MDNYKMYLYICIGFCLSSIILSLFKKRWTLVLSIILLLLSIVGAVISLSSINITNKQNFRSYYYKPVNSFMNLERMPNYEELYISFHKESQVILINSLDELNQVLSEKKDNNIFQNLNKNDYSDDFFLSKSLIIYTYNNNSHIGDIKLTSIEGTTFNIAVAEGKIIEDKKDSYGENICLPENSHVFYIKTDKINDKDSINFNIKKYEVKLEYINEPYYVDKPILYFYPEEPTDIEVKLNKSEELVVSYPNYTDSWKFKAYPDSTLEINSKLYYSLYYEPNSIIKNGVKEEGFCISKDEIVEFLEEKLEILGLNYKEKEEFIIYWLPRLQAHEYDYIRFLTREEIEENMPIDIIPAPDSFIRISMEWKGLESPIIVKEQQLTPIQRKGFTVVEWGGINLNKTK